jgi:hypothetical protein
MCQLAMPANEAKEIRAIELGGRVRLKRDQPTLILIHDYQH